MLPTALLIFHVFPDGNVFFDEYEKDRKAKDKLIIKLQTQVTELTDKVSNLSVQVDEQEQYSRRNCLLIQGTEENRNEPYQLILLMSISG